MDTYVTMSNVVSIQNPPDSLLNYCKDNLRVNNPDYLARVRMGLWAGDTSPVRWRRNRGLLF